MSKHLLLLHFSRIYFVIVTVFFAGYARMFTNMFLFETIFRFHIELNVTDGLAQLNIQ